MKTRAAVVFEPNGPYTLTEVELAPPREGEALVRVAACGLCHTDEAARGGFMETPFPMVLGHEGSGVVAAVGPGVADFRPGDRVGMSYGWCGRCPACRAGQPYGCERNRALNFSGLGYDGTSRLSLGGKPVSTFFGQSAFATYAVAHQHNLYPLPEDLPLEAAAPLGCGIQTGAGAVLNYLKPAPGSSVVITGCGVVGLSAVMAAKIAGCGRILCADKLPQRLALARELGATDLFGPETEDLPAAVRAALGGRGSDYSIDCTGSGACVRHSLNCLRALGVCVVLGATAELTIHVERELMGLGRSLVGLVEGCSVPRQFIPRLLAEWRRGRFPFDRLLSFYDFDDIRTAQADALAGKTVKSVLVMPEAD